MENEPLGEPIVIRFDGLDADNHVIELRSLSESLRGLSRIIAASAHFAITQEVSLRSDRQVVRVVVRPPRDGCVIIDAIVQYAHQHPLIAGFASSTISALTASTIAFIVGKAVNKRDEMKHLSAALNTAIGALGAKDQPTIDRLLSTVDRMADALSGAVKQAVAPVGVSARTLSVGVPSVPSATVVVDEADKAAINSEATLRVEEEKVYDVLLTELDIDDGSCRVHLAGDPEGERHDGRITDPAIQVPNSPYAVAFAAQERMSVQAKATTREGAIERLYISNYVGRDRGGGALELA